MRAGLLVLLTICFCATGFSQTSLSSTIEQITGSLPAKVGVHAMVLETGDTVSVRGHEYYPMQSVYKFPINMAILNLVDKGKLTLDQRIRISPSDLLPRGRSPIRDKYPQGNVDLTIRELLRYDIVESDGTACDVLLRVLGGCSKAQAYLHSIGVRELDIATTEKEQHAFDDLVQYRNRATPAAMTQLLKLFYAGKLLSGKSQAVLLDDLTNNDIGLKRLKGLLPAGTVVAHKTGTSSTYNGLTRATNDVGIITMPNGRHLLITVFVSDTYAVQEEREAVIARIALAAFDFWKDK